MKHNPCQVWYAAFNLQVTYVVIYSGRLQWSYIIYNCILITGLLASTIFVLKTEAEVENWNIIVHLFLFVIDLSYIWFIIHGSLGLTQLTSATNMRQWTGSVLLQVMACRLFCAKPLSVQQCWFIVNWTLRYKNVSEILIKIPNFSLMKMCLRMSSAKWWLFFSGEMR